MNTMFASPVSHKSAPFTLADLKASTLGLAATTEAQTISEQLLTFSERGALSRTGHLSQYEEHLVALCLLDKIGDQLAQSAELTESALISAYVLEAARVARINQKLAQAVVALLAGGQAADGTLSLENLADLLSSPTWAPYRSQLLHVLGLSDSHQRPLLEAIRLFKILELEAGEWSPARLQALPLIWTRHGVQANLCFEMLVLLVVMGVLSSESLNLTSLHQFIEKLTLAAPVVHAEIMLRSERAAKAKTEAILADHGLAPADIFTLMNVPIGPVRGQVMANIKILIADPETPAVTFGEYDTVLRARARAARQALNL